MCYPDSSPGDDNNSIDNFYKYQRKNFLKVMDCLLLGKKINLRKEKAYNFNDKGKEFVLYILKSFTSSEMKLLRKGRIDKIDSKFIVELIDKFIDYLKSLEIENNILKEIVKNVCTYYSYSERKMKLISADLYMAIEPKIFNLEKSNYLIVDDKLVWLEHLNNTVKEVLRIYNLIYEDIDEYRSYEITEVDKISYEKKDDSLILTVIREINERIENDSKILQLNEEINKLGTSVVGFISEESKEYQKLNSLLSERKEVIENEVCAKYKIEKSVIELKQNKFVYNPKDSGELFNKISKEVIQEQEENKKPFYGFKNDEEKNNFEKILNKALKKYSCEELPDIDKLEKR